MSASSLTLAASLTESFELLMAQCVHHLSGPPDTLLNTVSFIYRHVYKRNTGYWDTFQMVAGYDKNMYAVQFETFKCLLLSPASFLQPPQPSQVFYAPPQSEGQSTFGRLTSTTSLVGRVPEGPPLLLLPGAETSKTAVGSENKYRIECMARNSRPPSPFSSKSLEAIVSRYRRRTMRDAAQAALPTHLELRNFTGQ